MQVILSANVSHYYYAALALQQAGYLQRYICAVRVGKRQKWLYRVLPNYWEKKLRGREIPGIDSTKVRSIWLPELLQKGLPKLHITSPDRSNWVNNYLFDWRARTWVTKCDVFHFVSSVGLYSARKAKKGGAIIVCDERTEYPDFQRRIVLEEQEYLGIKADVPGALDDRKIKAEYKIADYIIVASNYAKRTFLEAGFPEQKLFVVPYGVDLHQFEAREKSGGIFRVVFAGQVIPRKGVHYLIQAFQELALPNSELLLVGTVDASMRNIVGRAVKQTPGIRAVGNVPRLELFRYYESGAVFVLPSLADTFGLVVTEAMACGLPVIITENTGSQDLVTDGREGFVVPIRSVQALKEKLLLLYQDEGLRRAMGEAARVKVLEFTWERYGERLLEVYWDIGARAGKTYLPPLQSRAAKETHD